MNYQQYIDDNTLRCEASHRGGGIEIDLAELLPEVDEPLMSAYQNYLGGGMLGAIQENHNFDNSELTSEQVKTVEELADSLKRYSHDLTNHEDEWGGESYEQNQLVKPVSAY